jgi:hypothetical protein
MNGCKNTYQRKALTVPGCETSDDTVPNKTLDWAEVVVLRWMLIADP